MLSVLERYVDDFESADAIASAARWRAPAGLRHVVVAGMGGSGVSGTLLEELARGESPVPIVVVKDYTLPAFVDRHTLVIAVSYSGQTEETLSVARQALRLRATLWTLSSGGALANASRAGRGRHQEIPGGRQPRAALPLLLGATVAIARRAGLTRQRLSAAEGRSLRRVRAALDPDVPTSKNPAKRFAHALHDKFPVWYAAAPLVGVAHRGRAQANENSKQIARHDQLPEGNHNDLVAWDAVSDGRAYFVGLLRSDHEPTPVRRRFGFLQRRLESRGVATDEYRTHPGRPLSTVLEGLLFVDYVSVYAAILRGVDPTPVTVIDELKRHLARR